MNEYLKTALDCLREMTRAEVTPASRLQAADLLARYGLEVEYLDRRLTDEPADAHTPLR